MAFLGEFKCDYKLESGAKCDLALVQNGHVHFNIEFKNELRGGGGSKDPNGQNLLYYLHAHRTDSQERLDPVLLQTPITSNYLVHCLDTKMRFYLIH